MKIEESKFYLKITAPLRAANLINNVQFGDEGFSYHSQTLAFLMRRQSKNNYVVTAIYNTTCEQVTFSSASSVVDFCIKLINFDEQGTFKRLLKRSESTKMEKPV